MSLSVELEKQLKGFHLHVAFDHEEGILGILGGSGMGKSMTLKMMAGLVKPDRGRVRVNGRIVYDSEAGIDLPARERQIGYLFQQYALFPHMTVAENIGIAMKEKGAARREAIDRLLEQFSLQSLGGRMPSQLSGGQQQRVALARILASQPQLLLLDEPFSALDSYLKEQLLEEMRERLRAYGGDVVMVSHSRDEIYQFCDQLLVVDQGEVKAFGATRDVFDQPGCVEAARLTGCKNIAAARRLDAHRADVPEWHCELFFEKALPQPLRAVGIRAHYIQILKEKPADEMNVAAAYTESVSELPFEWYYFFRVPEGGRIWWKIAKSHGGQRRTDYLPEVGETVYLRMPEESLIALQ